MPDLLFHQRLNIEKNLSENPNHLSSFSFMSIFAWQDFFRFDLQVINNCLCVFARNEMGTFLYLPPLGGNVTPEIIEACFAVMEKANGAGGVTRIENVSAEQLAWFPAGKFKRYHKGYEYCYYRKDIADLRGNPYKSKRSSYNQFISSYAHEYLPFNDDMMDECLDLYRRWAKERAAAHPDDMYGHMLEENQKVHARVMKHFRELGAIGRVVKVEGKIRAYSFGFPIHREMFCILFEVAELSIKGVATYIFREFCRDVALQAYSFINAMDDLAMEHIRDAKMSFHPSLLLPAYVITKVE